MALTVKICGLKDEAALDAAVETGADMVGLVLFARSPRNVSLTRAAELAGRARGRAEIVALVVDPDPNWLHDAVTALSPDWVQFHGTEAPAALAAWRPRLKSRLMKALPIARPEDLAAATAYAPVVDRLLFDARPPQGADRPGGHGQPFDWSLLRGADPATHYMLSGGLTPANVAAAVAATGAPGVDVSSGVESAPGVKDPRLIRAFVTAARGAVVPMRTTTRLAS
ncbi:MAG: phosphoribosylanthranilate isomerase [Bauldia sp.]